MLKSLCSVLKIEDLCLYRKLDLIVGAPQFYDRNDQVGGAVYVYVNKGLSTIGPSPTQR